jgi:hypothetical protein
VRPKTGREETRSKASKDRKRSKRGSIKQRKKREAAVEAARQPACWEADVMASHHCRVDDDCGVDGKSCNQRVCSPHGYCTDSE